MKPGPRPLRTNPDSGQTRLGPHITTWDANRIFVYRTSYTVYNIYKFIPYYITITTTYFFTYLYY